MTKQTYKVTSVQGAEFCLRHSATVEVGEEVELELDAEQRNALIAAGWLEASGRKEKK